MQLFMVYFETFGAREGCRDSIFFFAHSRGTPRSVASHRFGLYTFAVGPAFFGVAVGARSASFLLS